MPRKKSLGSNVGTAPPRDGASVDAARTNRVDIFFKSRGPVTLYMNSVHANVFGVHYQEYLEGKTSLYVDFVARYSEASTLDVHVRVDFRQVEMVLFDGT